MKKKSPLFPFALIIISNAIFFELGFSGYTTLRTARHVFNTAIAVNVILFAFLLLNISKGNILKAVEIIIFLLLASIVIVPAYFGMFY